MAQAGSHVAVVGAGVFGCWTARKLRDAGCRVTLIDFDEPGHVAAGSGGESRITRSMYGAETLYMEWARRSVSEWRELSERADVPLFHETGVLWMYREGDPFAEASAATLEAAGISVERLGPGELRARYPILEIGSDDRALLEPEAGALRAGAAIRRLVGELEADGVERVRGRVVPIRAGDAEEGALNAVELTDGRRIQADVFVVACGAWLDRVCPDAMAGRLFVTRQEVVFFGVDAGRIGGLPIWADMPFYGFPPLAGRGFKVAHDEHGPRIEDVDAVDRRVGPDAVATAREFLHRRFPELADAPVVDSRVCQYANSSSGDLLADRHPGLENVWLVGCGSGHGFKQGPAVGAHAAGLVLGRETPIEAFGLASKRTSQARAIQ
ncbi:MAG: FAD-dependent oxidoreductase [Gemmatimonadota bacterium]